MPITHLDLPHLLASTDHAELGLRRKLDDVSISIAKAKKVIVVSGAGISCSSGIPDFRSADGLYSLVKRRYPDAFVTGRDLFSAGLFMNPSTTAIFLTFIAELSLACQKATPTKTHHFIHKLDRSGKLLRSYTQNVDGFERRMGMESGGRGKGLHKKNTRNVELHGDLGRVRCTLCFTDYAAEKPWTEMMREGEAPECPKCLDRCSARVKRSARATPIGCLRPSIVLYDEPHPLGDDIGMLQAHDMSRTPDIMIIMGTSLKVSGLKALVKDFAKAIHGAKKPGLVVFVNATKPGKEWEGVIDVHVQGETDAWVEKVEETWKRVKPADWEVQTKLDLGIVGPASVGIKAKANAKGQPMVELPTPRPSESPSRSRSSTLSSLHSPPVAPLSPSKRRNMPTPDPTPSPKKARPTAPSTGVVATPGKGNLFAARAPAHSAAPDEDMAMPGSQESLVLASQSMAMVDEDEDEEEELAEAERDDDDDAVDEGLAGVDSDVNDMEESDDDDHDDGDLCEDGLDAHDDVDPVAIKPDASSRRPLNNSRTFLSTRTSSAPSLSISKPVARTTRTARPKAPTPPADILRPRARAQSARDKENAPPAYEAATSMSKKMGQRKAKVPGSPLKTAITGRATRARVERAEKAVMAVRRSNRV